MNNKHSIKVRIYVIFSIGSGFLVPVFLVAADLHRVMKKD
jgi:hypothetical protein